jgi:hypothetical protein
MAKVGRNDPSPCGSGRKYKRCCGSAAQPKLPDLPDGRPDAQKFPRPRATIESSFSANLSRQFFLFPETLPAVADILCVR